MLNTYESFCIVGNHIVGYADDTLIYTVFPRQLSCTQVKESLNQILPAIYSSCLKWHMRLNYNKTKSMMISRCRNYAPGYSDLTLGGAEFEEVRSLRILGVTFNHKLTFESHLCEVVSKAARSLGVVPKTGKLFDCPRVIKSCFNAYVLAKLEYFATVCMSSTESQLSSVDRVFRSAERLCERELCCLGHRNRANASCLLCKIYNRTNPHLHEYLHNFLQFVILALQLLWVS